MVVPSALDGVALPGTSDGERELRRQRRIYTAMAVALVLLIGLAAADVRWAVYGVDSTAVTAEGRDGVRLRVEYTELTRPALASPLAIEVTDPGGFDGPIEIAISRPYIEVWDENAFYPSPDAETGDERWVVYEFDPPEGSTLRVFYDARLEPARQSGARGRVQLRGGGEVMAEVAVHTEVRP